MIDEYTGVEFRLPLDAVDTSFDETLMQRLANLQRVELAARKFPQPPVERLVRDHGWVHVAGVSRFWEQHSGGQARLTGEQAATHLLQSVHGQQKSVVFLILGHPAGIELWLGVRGQSSKDTAALLRASYPGIQITREKEGTAELPRGLERLRFAAEIVGQPSYPPGDQAPLETSVGRIDSVCRGMYGQPWAYLVFAKPWPQSAARALATQLLQQVWAAEQSFTPLGAGAKPNPPAKQLGEWLQAKLDRINHAMMAGLWATHVWLLTGDEATLARGNGLIQGSFGGEFATPAPLIAVRCNTNPAIKTGFLEPLSTRDVAVFTHLPQEEYPGYPIMEHIRLGVNAPIAAPGEPVVSAGDVLNQGDKSGITLNIPLKDFSKHVLIAGVTGSGKTNTCFHLLEQLWKQNIPFLVVESAKSEYRDLLKDPAFGGDRGRSSIQVFTVGNETLSPLRLNPFEVPAGFSVQAHVDYLKSLFAAAFVLYPPMPYVLEQSLQEIYEDRGWDLIANENRRGRRGHRLFPTLRDLSAKLDVVITRMGYEERITMDVRAGLLARINQLRLGGKGPMFNTRHSTPVETLFRNPCVLELKLLVNDDEKAFMIGLLLIRLYEFFDLQGQPPDNALQHVTLIEEAHRLLRNVSTESSSEVSANPKGKAIEVFANILSEIRAFGEGFLIAEQVPVKLTPDAIKNTNLKLLHRLVAEDDRKLVGSAINLNEAEVRHLAVLQSGDAVAYSEGMHKAVLNRVPLSYAKKAGAVHVEDRAVRESMENFWIQNSELRKPYAGCFRCHHSGGQHLCVTFEKDLEEPSLRRAFRRLFNSIRFNNQDAILSGAREFKSICQRLFASRAKELSIYCIFTGLVEPEVERRGEMAGWSFEDVDQTIQLFSFAFHQVAALLDTSPPGPWSIELLSPLDALLADLSSRVNGLYVSAELPFSGCEACWKKCQYRFDMERELRERSDDSGPPTADKANWLKQDFVPRSRLAASQTLPADSLLELANAALCFGVQVFARWDLYPHEQAQFAGQLANALKHQEGATK